MSYGQFVAQGRQDEKLVARAMKQALGGSFAWATFEEDTKGHVDIWWTPPSGEKDGVPERIGIDVKGMRKLSRHDPSPSNSITWLEIQNVNGEPGSLYGKAKYVAFIRIGKILLVDREKLLHFALGKVARKTPVIFRPSECYVPYTRARWGRNDIAFMAYLDDIESLAEKVIPLPSVVASNAPEQKTSGEEL